MFIKHWPPSEVDDHLFEDDKTIYHFFYLRGNFSRPFVFSFEDTYYVALCRKLRYYLAFEIKQAIETANSFSSVNNVYTIAYFMFIFIYNLVLIMMHSILSIGVWLC